MCLHNLIEDHENSLVTISLHYSGYTLHGKDLILPFHCVLLSARGEYTRLLTLYRRGNTLHRFAGLYPHTTKISSPPKALATGIFNRTGPLSKDSFCQSPGVAFCKCSRNVVRKWRKKVLIGFVTAGCIERKVQIETHSLAYQKFFSLTLQHCCNLV